MTTRRWRNQTLPRGQAFQVDRLTGRTRVILTGEAIPEADEDAQTAEPEDDRRVSAVSVGAVKTTGSEDHYCMLDSGANVMVIPWKEGMEGDHTMCALVGDNKTDGLVVARLATRQRTHLIVAVKGAKPLIPISYLIRIAHYRATWRMMGEHDCFQMKDGYGDPVMVNEDEDLLYVGKTTLWRIGHDLYNSALHTTGMTWSDVWKTLTGEEAPIRSIFAIQAQTNVDFVELYNPGNFTAHKGELIAGTVIDCKVNPQFDLTSSQVRQEVATLIEKEDPLFLIGAPPCTEQQYHDVRQHAGLGHGQHDNQDMNLEDMLPLRQAFNLDQDDAMLEDDNDQLREQVMSPNKARSTAKSESWPYQGGPGRRSPRRSSRHVQGAPSPWMHCQGILLQSPSWSG